MTRSGPPPSDTSERESLREQLRLARAALAASRQREEQLQATVDFQDRLLNAIADPVFIKDEHHRWVVLNDAFCAFLGQPREALVGRTDHDFFPPQEADEFWRWDSEVLETGADNLNEEAFTDAHGERHVIATRKSRYVDASGARFIVGVIRDITERTRLETELREQNERLKEFDRLKTGFVDAVSHELRTPLTSMVGYAEFLEDEIGGRLSPDQREFVSQILAAGERLQLLVDDLLDFSQLASGAFRLSRRQLDVREPLRATLESLRPQAQARGQTLSLAMPDFPVVLMLDPGRFSQVLVNLVGNAIKFSPVGGCVEVRLTADGSAGRVEVLDTGPGIAAEHLQRVFDRFYQVDNRSTRECGGVGLGLAIAKALVQAHGGTIGVHSRAGGGCRFWFELPAGSAAEAAEPPVV